MKTIRAFLRAFGEFHTYDVRTNVHLWFGVLWGIPVPFYLLILTEGPPTGPLTAVLHSTPLRVFFMLHPALFGLVFGALGTLRMNLERENERLIGELRGQAWVDPLTGLYNRRYVMEEFRNILKRALRSREPVRAVLFDLDGFKAVNDTRGHLEGDKVLQKAAAALRGAVREGDLLGRFGGDEFLLVAAGDAATVRDIVDRCREAVRSSADLTISAGMAAVATPGEAPESLIRRADADLSAAKQAGYKTRRLKRRTPPETPG